MGTLHRRPMPCPATQRALEGEATVVEFLGINHAAFFVPTDLWDPQHALGEGGRKRERERERERERQREE